jgi:hypothetical protein
MGNAGIEPAISAVRGEEHTKPSPGSVRRTVLCSVRQLRTRPRDTTCVLEATNDTRTSAHPRRFTCKSSIFKVEPRGFEPLTPAVQRQIRWFTGVVDNSQTRLNEPTPPLAYPDKRLCISLHRCRTGVPAAARSKAATGSLEERCGIFARASWGWNSAWLSSWRSPVLIGSTVDFSRGTFVKPLRTRLPRPSSEPRW